MPGKRHQKVNKVTANSAFTRKNISVVVEAKRVTERHKKELSFTSFVRDFGITGRNLKGKNRKENTLEKVFEKVLHEGFVWKFLACPKEENLSNLCVCV